MTAEVLHSWAADAQSELEALRNDKDAERYRFLRSDFSVMGANINGHHSWVYRRNLSLRGPTLDAAIDTALGAEAIPLVVRLREAGMGHDEWRVQDPKDGNYCISFRRSDALSPEYEARKWLADHRKRFPSGPFAQFEVACVRMLLTRDKLLNEAADEIERLRTEPAEAALPQAVRNERERCAALCETWTEAAERDSGPEAAGWLHQMAQHMRSAEA